MEENKDEIVEETKEEVVEQFVEEPDVVFGTEEEKKEDVVEDNKETVIEEVTNNLEEVYGPPPEEIKNEPEETNSNLKKCVSCGENIDVNTKFCPNCGSNQEESNSNKCPGCGEELKEGAKFCDKCGYKITQDEPTPSNPPKKKHTLAIVLSIVGGVLLLLLIVGIIAGVSVVNKAKEAEEYKNTPVKVDISMSNYYGNIDYILEDFGLDFDLVTKGGNCYSGVQTGTFETEKYGLLHTEYSYCKSNETLTFRLYNLETDQKLREPDTGEVPTYDKYGKRTSDYNI